MNHTATRSILTGAMLIGLTGFTSGGNLVLSAPSHQPALVHVQDVQNLLLEDGQKVLFTFTEGTSSQVIGSKGKGKFVHLFRSNISNFGPAKIISHTKSSLTFRGKRDTCIMTDDMKVSCKKIGSGTWRLI